ncbi:unnamed protein product [Macrosiphum euphorbiae]|uniref:Uncharacterized protein n=1 Tax=Macrosiphum euphorbiae TaxID=13131 RepID=A0AAV0XR07_9HEMI|nr:unnamed protein product [Macrosiphum euphorbiae]
MRTITGTVRSTQTQWLPVLAHIDPPEVRRQRASQSIINKIKRNDDLPIYNDLVITQINGLNPDTLFGKKQRPTLIHRLNRKGHG